MKQKIMPALSSMKDIERFLESPYQTGVILETHIGQIKYIAKMARDADKKLIYHMDLIHGLKNDEYGTEYLCQEFRPYGIASTKASVIQQAKKNNVLSVLRIFMLDSHAIERSYRIIEKTNPDYIEVLPGSVPEIIQEVSERFSIPILAGGLIRSPKEASRALEAGAAAITTSKRELWELYKEKV